MDGCDHTYAQMNLFIPTTGCEKEIKKIISGF